jgi:hypothetical protein
MLAALSFRRVLTWVILGFNTVTIYFFINSLSRAGANCSGLTGTQLQSCETTTAMSVALSVGVLVFFLVVGNLALGAAWLVTAKHNYRTCPVCLAKVEASRIICDRCGCNVLAPSRRAKAPLVHKLRLSS